MDVCTLVDFYVILGFKSEPMLAMLPVTLKTNTPLSKSNLLLVCVQLDDPSKLP